MPDIFSQDALAKIVEDAHVDPSRGKNAVVGSIDERGVQVVASFRFKKDRWTVQAASRREWTGDTSVGARVMLQW